MRWRRLATVKTHKSDNSLSRSRFFHLLPLSADEKARVVSTGYDL
jgi:hypothetical protein